MLQEHPSLRGTPLAMLAAQCNKLSSKSPPPLADAAVGKGFHPWKKSPQGAPSPGSTGVSAASSVPSQRSSAASNTTYSRSVMTSCSSVPTTASYGSDLYFPGPQLSRPLPTIRTSTITRARCWAKWRAPPPITLH